MWADWSWISQFMQTPSQLTQFDKIVKGVPTYKDPVDILTFIMPQNSRVQLETGEWYESHTAIYFRDLPEGIIPSNKDKISTPFGGQYTIKSIRPYVSPTGQVEMWEVRL